jgi:hypothetical protein
MDSVGSYVRFPSLCGAVLMIAIRFEYNGTIRAGTLIQNKISKKKNRYFSVYFGNGVYKSFSWARAVGVELYNLSGLSVQVFKIN